MINKPIYCLRPLLFLLLAVPLCTRAQQADSLAALRGFMQVCHSYKQLPLQLTVRMNSHANLVTAPQDTVNVEAAFYMDEHGSYVRMGEMEQVANDSLLLLVSHQAHQMLLYANHSPLAGRLQSYLGLNLSDSSLNGFAARYAIVVGPGNGKNSRYDISSRALLAGTALPRETIQVLYDAGTMQPVEFVQCRRSLVSIDSADYVQFSALPAWKDRLVKLPGNGWWAVKEVFTDFRYASIAHKRNQALPVRIIDRVAATAPGVYAPVKPYEQFMLNQFPDDSTR